MAIALEVVALSFGPVGTDGTLYAVPVQWVETITPVGINEEAIIRFRMPEDIDVEVQSAMGFDIAVSSTPELKFMALLLTTKNNEYLFPLCRIDYGSLNPIDMSFTALIDKSMKDDNGNAGCCIVINGSRRPISENISFD